MDAQAVTRRTFLKGAVAAGAGTQFFTAAALSADMQGKAIGLQLYTVGADFDKDPASTLKKVAAAGFTEVELSPLSKVPTSDLRKMLADTGLRNPSGHYMLSDLLGGVDKATATAKELGQQYMIVTVPGVADAARFKSSSSNQMEGFLKVLNSLTLDDWKWNAEQFNRAGEAVKKAGLQLGYHNHNFEFRKLGDTTGYDEFLRLTDPNLVHLELDCGWMTVAGLNPVDYLTRFPDRYRLLHIKDFKKGFTPTTTLAGNAPGKPVPTELGKGAIDYQPILAAAAKASVTSLFVEQEPPFTEMPALDAIKIDYGYLHGLVTTA